MKSLIQEALQRANAELAQGSHRAAPKNTIQQDIAPVAAPAAPAARPAPRPAADPFQPKAFYHPSSLPSGYSTPRAGVAPPPAAAAATPAPQPVPAQPQGLAYHNPGAPRSYQAASPAPEFLYHSGNGRHAAPVPAPAPVPVYRNPVDDELEAMVSSLNHRIKVVGCGGGGCNTLNRMAQSGAFLDNAELIAVNTDAQHLLLSPAQSKILIGKRLTRGLGAGAIPQVGERAALETEDEIRKALAGADMVFITAGMGGGTGTGSAPVVAKIAREMGALTIAVVTLPFKVEGGIRMENAEQGLARLRDAADTTIVVPNDKLLEVVPRLPINAAFKVADEILIRSIKGISEMITKPGLVNLDFADLKTIMKKGGVAMIGLGESDTDTRAKDAVLEALASPLLDVDISNATGVLVNVIGSPDMTISEAESCVQEVYQRVSPDARIIWGTGVNPGLDRTVRVMVVITGVRSKQILGPAHPRTTKAAQKTGLDFVL